MTLKKQKRGGGGMHVWNARAWRVGVTDRIVLCGLCNTGSEFNLFSKNYKHACLWKAVVPEKVSVKTLL